MKHKKQEDVSAERRNTNQEEDKAAPTLLVSLNIVSIPLPGKTTREEGGDRKQKLRDLKQISTLRLRHLLLVEPPPHPSGGRLLDASWNSPDSLRI